MVIRFATHMKALAANLIAGTVRRHCANIKKSLRTEKIYAMPCILVLTTSDSIYLTQESSGTTSTNFNKICQQIC